MSSPEAGSPPPRVTLLSTTPVKGFRLHHPDTVDLDANGAVGDRDFFLVDARNRLLSITRCGALARWVASFDAAAGGLTFESDDGETLSAQVERGTPLVASFFESRAVPGHFVDGPWTPRLSEVVGEPVRLVRAKEAGEANDVHPVSLMSDGSVAELARHADVEAVDPRRFRMLVGFSGVAPHEEDTWRLRTLRIGTAVLRVGGPVARCAAVTRNPASGETDLKTLHIINGYRGRQPNEFGDGLNFGVYGEVLKPGTIRVGDALHLDG